MCPRLRGRAKEQRLRTNVQELSALACDRKRTHDPTEWNRDQGAESSQYFCSAWEAESFASLASHALDPQMAVRSRDIGRHDKLLRVPGIVLRRESNAYLRHTATTVSSADDRNPMKMRKSVYAVAGCAKYEQPPAHWGTSRNNMGTPPRASHCALQ